MASTYSSNLRFELIGAGEQSGSWNTTTNTNLGTLIEEAISGVSAVVMGSDANYTLTTANGSTDQARQAVLLVTSGVSLSATRDVICPTKDKVYIVKNSTTGSQSIRVKTASGTGITITNGETALVHCDGTNVVASVSEVVKLTLSGDTASGDKSAIGYTAAEGIIITGQGSTSDVTLKNDADATVLTIPTGTTNVSVVGTVTAAGTSVFTNLDISGDVDVDGTTNLDVVDIDGAVDMATTLAVAGNVDFNGDLDVDGTTNLDVVDIDGAVNMATTALVTGVLTTTAQTLSLTLTAQTV